jgi:hypothetical protein
MTLISILLRSSGSSCSIMESSLSSGAVARHPFESHLSSPGPPCPVLPFACILQQAGCARSGCPGCTVPSLSKPPSRERRGNVHLWRGRVVAIRWSAWVAPYTRAAPQTPQTRTHPVKARSAPFAGSLTSQKPRKPPATTTDHAHEPAHQTWE